MTEGWVKGSEGSASAEGQNFHFGLTLIHYKSYYKFCCNLLHTLQTLSLHQLPAGILFHEWAHLGHEGGQNKSHFNCLWHQDLLLDGPPLPQFGVLR